MDDEIKKVKAHFYQAATFVKPEDLQDSIPMCFPMTHNIDGLPMIAKYPISEWKNMGAPYFSQKSWCMLCMKIADKDFEHLEKVFETAQKEMKRLGDDDSYRGTIPVYDSHDDNVSTTAAGSTVGSSSVAGWGAASTVSPSPCR